MKINGDKITLTTKYIVINDYDQNVDIKDRQEYTDVV